MNRTKPFIVLFLSLVAIPAFAAEPPKPAPAPSFGLGPITQPAPVPGPSYGLAGPQECINGVCYPANQITYQRTANNFGLNRTVTRTVSRIPLSVPNVQPITRLASAVPVQIFYELRTEPTCANCGRPFQQTAMNHDSEMGHNSEMGHAEPRRVLFFPRLRRFLFPRRF